MKEISILILSAGTRDLVVRAFRKELAGRGRVVATDCSSLAPALYDADKAYIVPRITEPDYIDIILDICRKEQITGVFSLIDPELSLIARERKRFEEVGTTAVVSPYDLTETCLDKYTMYKLLTEQGYRTGLCFTDVESFEAARADGKIGYPVFVKPQKGSASININKVEDGTTLRTLFHNYSDLMIQEYMPGQEYGADVYIDMISGKCVSIFLKKKIKMRAGETDKSVSVIDRRIFARIREFAEKQGFRGMIDMDLFCLDGPNGREDGTWYLSEVNPRFGGGYPHAYASGVNFAKMLVNNLSGKENEEQTGAYEEGICMMKYNDVCIRREEELVK